MRQAARHAQQQAAAAAEALAPAHRLDPADIAWGERRGGCRAGDCCRMIALGPGLRTASGERPCSGGFAVQSPVLRECACVSSTAATCTRLVWCAQAWGRLRPALLAASRTRAWRPSLT